MDQQSLPNVFHDTLMQGRRSMPIKAWIPGEEIEATARKQLNNLAHLPFIHKHIAVMPDVHAGIGSTVGTVIATKKAIIPAAVGVDIGCGMMAIETTLRAEDLPHSLAIIRSEIERAVPHGYESCQGRYTKGTFDVQPASHTTAWRPLGERLIDIEKRNDQVFGKHPGNQLGTLGGGNHFIELCLDTTGKVWVMLHSGSRGVGNKIGTYFTEKAKEEMERYHIKLADPALAYLVEGSELFGRYWEAMQWAQQYAMANRDMMMESVLRVLRKHLPPFQLARQAINCHHNYAELENHFGENCYVTRKGAVRARADDLGIIPGSMGAKSFIVQGKGNADSFCSCSHGAGRKMSRKEAERTFTAEDIAVQTAGVECKKDISVVDEIPGSYKDIDQVMSYQGDLVTVVATLKQVLCVKG